MVLLWLQKIFHEVVVHFVGLVLGFLGDEEHG